MCVKSRLILGNLLWNVKHNDSLQDAVLAWSGLGPATGGRNARDASDRRLAQGVAALTGTQAETVRRLFKEFENTGWSLTSARHESKDMHEQSGDDDASMTEIGLQPCVVNSALPPLSREQGHPGNGADSESEEDNIISSRPLAALKLNSWRSHANYDMAMRHAELAAFWITAGLPEYRWEEFVTWFQACTGQGADINQSKHFLWEFGHSLARTILSRTAVTVHSIIPALGLPSDFARVIDVVTLSGISLLVIVYVHVDPTGRLTWSLIACPALGSVPATGGTSSDFFRFHTGPKLVELVHVHEERMRIGKKDRALRLVMTMADGAIQGPGSVDFEKHEAKIDDRDPLHTGVCGFHKLDCAGGQADRQFAATSVYDRFLRLVRQHFAWGTGLLVLRATASEFSRLAEGLREEARTKSEKAAEAEAEGRTSAAARYRKSCAKSNAHAFAFEHAGWTTFRRPLAPKADGTRKVVWQTAARQRLFDIFPLIYWGIKVRMMETLGTAHEAVRKEGRRVTEDCGQRTKQMKMWRAMGRTLCDIHMLVFNIGRSDFRAKHAKPMAMLLQVSTRSALETPEQVMLMSFEMFNAIGMLMDMLAIVRFLEMVLEKQPATGGHLTKGVLWATARTLMAHRCWRKFPGLTRHLPHILLGGTMQGVSLQDGVFKEPLPKVHAKGRSATGGTMAEHSNHSRANVLHRRHERFGHVKHALEVLLSWARYEKHVSKRRYSSMAPPYYPGQGSVSRNKNETSSGQKASCRADLTATTPQTTRRGTRSI